MLKTYETKHGPMLAFAGDRFMTPTLEKAGEYAPQEWALLDQLTLPGMVVAEIGANIGVHAVPLARKCAPGAFYCFEPQPRVFQVLCANLALNGIGNARAYPDAVGEASGWGSVPAIDYDQQGNFGGVSVKGGAAAGIPIRIITLDSFALPSLGLLKIDVEGFEPMVLRGARETILRCRPNIYIENDRPDQQGEVIGLLTELGYTLYWHTPALAEPSVFDGHTYLSVNMIGFPTEVGSKVTGVDPIDPDNWTSPVPPELI